MDPQLLLMRRVPESLLSLKVIFLSLNKILRLCLFFQAYRKEVDMYTKKAMIALKNIG